MWPFRKKVKQRRLEVRRKAQATRPPLWRRFREAGGLASLALGVLLYAGALAMDVWPFNPLPYRIGQYLPQDIHARVSFEMPSEYRREEAIRNARRDTPATFRLDEKRLEALVAELKGFPDLLKAATQPAAGPDEKLRKRFGLSDEKAIQAWLAFAQAARKEKYIAEIDRLEDQLRETCTVAPEELKEQQEGRGAKTFLADSRKEVQQKSIYALVAVTDAEKIEYEASRLVRSTDKTLRDGLRTYLLAALSEGPLYACDAAASQEDINRALKAIDADPPTKPFAAGEVLVRRSRRDIPGGQEVRGLSEADLAVLREEHEACARAEGLDDLWGRAVLIGGRAAILLLVMVPLAAYVRRYQPRILKHHGRGLALVVVLLLMLAINRVMSLMLELNPYAAVLPIIIAAIVLTIAFDQRFALATGAAMTILVVLQFRAGMDLFVVLMVAVAATIFQLREIRTRSKLIEAAAVTGVLVAAAVLAGGMAHGVPWRFILFDALWGAGFTLLVGFLVQGVLPMIERAFGVATSMTLLEWCDASKPLLKRLAMEAPGTYNHSLQLGAICEAAAESISARGLLARVGAYYHDIGKISKSEYFVENQVGGASKHEKLSPAMSLLIIIGHVKDGLEMAREYGLPPVLHEFIATHHGTTLVQYFYRVAAQQRKDEKDRAPDEVEFRYPGPKPQSPEAAILMLADASESSVRSMSDPTPGRIENQVHAMVSRRLMDGQLDECELTLREVHQIEASLVKSLCGVYHSRIAYPTPVGEKPSAAELPRPEDRGENGYAGNGRNGANGSQGEECPPRSAPSGRTPAEPRP